MKINSLPDRDKEHKKIKDICDIFALLWYSNIKTEQIKKKICEFISEENINNCLAKITKEDLQKAGPQLSHSTEEIQRVIDVLKQ